MMEALEYFRSLFDQRWKEQMIVFVSFLIFTLSLVDEGFDFISPYWEVVLNIYNAAFLGVFLGIFSWIVFDKISNVFLYTLSLLPLIVSMFIPMLLGYEVGVAFPSSYSNSVIITSTLGYYGVFGLIAWLVYWQLYKSVTDKY